MTIAEHLNIIYSKFIAIISHTSLPQIFFEKILRSREKADLAARVRGLSLKLINVPVAAAAFAASQW